MINLSTCTHFGFNQCAICYFAAFSEFWTCVYHHDAHIYPCWSMLSWYDIIVISKLTSPQLLSTYVSRFFFYYKKCYHIHLYTDFFFPFVLLCWDIFSFCYVLSNCTSGEMQPVDPPVHLEHLPHCLLTFWFILISRKAVVIVLIEALCQGGWIFFNISFHNFISTYTNISLSSLGSGFPHYG